MNKFDFITIGGATEDLVFHTKEGLLIDNEGDILRQELLAFEQGAKVRVDKIISLFGGGASNVAVNLSNLGFKVSAFVNLGKDDRAKKILDNFKNNKVNTSLIKFDKKEDSGTSVILSNNGDRIIFAYRGSNNTLSLSKKDLKFFKSGKALYVTSVSKDVFKSFPDIFSLDNSIYWNPGIWEISLGVEKLARYIKKTEILMLNKDEALELLKKSRKYKDCKDSYLKNIKNLLEIIKSYGPKKLIITDGKNGAHFFDGVNCHYQKALSNKKTLDTTGVGDAFNSTFVAFNILTDGDYEKAMKLAALNAASVISVYGAQNGLTPLNKLIKK
jgi:ribokinase